MNLMFAVMYARSFSLAVVRSPITGDMKLAAASDTAATTSA